MDAAATYASDERPRPLGRPWVLLDMVSSVDGAVTVAGRSGGLSGTGDRQVFTALRSVADLILIGARTVRIERYGPPVLSAELERARAARGQAPVPRLVIVSRSLDLDPELPLFSGEERPIVLTCAATDPTRRERLEDVADLVTAGSEEVDLPRALAMLADRGTKVLLCEGGPTLFAGLLAEDLVDELCCSVSPLLVGGSAGRIVGPEPPVDTPRPLRLARLLEHDDELFARWVLDR